METTIAERAHRYAREKHRATNCTYDGGPYDVHLDMLGEVYEKFAYLLPDDETRVTAKCAIELHDVIEDCRVTYNDLMQEFGARVADVVYNVTNELGKNRHERSYRTYPKIASCLVSRFAKLCDRIANMTYSASKGSDMSPKYREEYAGFRAALYVTDELDPMWDVLDELSS